MTATQKLLTGRSSQFVDSAGGGTWRDGVGVPSNALGSNGDFYLNDSTADVYLKTAGVYSVVGNLVGSVHPSADIFSDIFQPGAGTINTATPGPVEGWTYTTDLQVGGPNASIIITPNSFNLHHNAVVAADYAAAKKTVSGQPASTDMKNTTLAFTWNRDNQIGPMGYGVKFSSLNAIYVSMSNVPAFTITVGRAAAVTRYTASGGSIAGAGPFKVVVTVDAAGSPLLYVNGVNIPLTNAGGFVLPIGMVADQFYIEYSLNFGTVQNATVSSVFLANGVFSPLLSFSPTPLGFIDVGARFGKTVAQSIPSGVATAVIFNILDYDSSGFFAAGTPTRFTIPEAGKYAFGFSGLMDITTVANTNVQLLCKLNGTTFICEWDGTLNTVNLTSIALNFEYVFAAADYIEFIVFQPSGLAINLNATAHTSPIGFCRRAG